MCNVHSKVYLRDGRNGQTRNSMRASRGARPARGAFTATMRSDWEVRKIHLPKICVPHDRPRVTRHRSCVLPQLCATAAKLHLSRRAWNLVDSFAPASLRGWRHHYLEPQTVHQHSEASLPPPHSEHIVSQCRQRHVGVQSHARQRPGPRHRTESAGRIAAWSIRWHRLQEMQLHGRVKHRRVKSPQHGFAFGQPFWVPLGTPVEGSATEEQWPYKQTREEAGRPSNPRLLA